jgi:type IV pilus assembly protein PilQ
MRNESGKLKATVKARRSAARRIRAMRSKLAWLKRRQAAVRKQAAARARAAARAQAVARRLTKAPAKPRLKTIKRIPKRFRITSRVASVNFRDTGASHRIMLKMRGNGFDYNLDRSTARTVALKVYGATVSRRLERSLDTSAFRGPVKLVSVYRNRARRGEVKVVVDLKHAARYKVTRRGPFLWVDFLKRSHVRVPRVASVPKALPVAVAASRVSGYSSTSRLYAPKRASGRAWQRKYRMRGRSLGPRVDMDFKDADIHNVLRLVGQVWRKNVVVADDVKGRVTIRMVNVRVGRALDVILKTKQLGLVWEGRNILRIARLADINKEIEAIQKARAAKRKMMPIVMRLIHVNYADAEKIAKQLKENVISKRGKVTFNKRTNAIIIRDVPPNIEIAKKLVRNLDTPTPQVLIEARIVEARSTFLREIGIQWGGSILATPGLGNPTGLLFPNSITSAGGAGDDVTRTGGLLGAAAANPNFAVNMPATVGSGQGGALGLSLGTLGGAFNVNLRLSAMEETGQVRIISSPKITTLDNVEAKIEQGVRIPISVVSAQGVNTQFEEANLALIVTPHVTNDGRVRLKLLVEKNEPDFVNTGARGDPTILKKTAKSEMLIRDGDTAVIGGIYTRTTSVSYSKVPWFADIPIIGWLFKKRKESDERSEVLIFVTPRVIKPGTASGGGTRGRGRRGRR